MSLAARFGLCLALLAGACDRAGGGADDTASTHLQSGAPIPAFVRQDARLTIAHVGLRRLEFASVAGPGIAFGERIATDGKGAYALEPAPPLASSTLDWDGFVLTHHLREGFFFRYRDFAVRDLRAFARNWRVTDLGQSVVVAGRPCARFRVERTSGAPQAFELSVDTVTNLVLASTEYDGGGSVIATMTYESIDLAPDLSQQAWHQPGNDETRLDPSRELGEQIEELPLLPKLLPAGYAPLEAAVVRADEAWLKLTYSDGVQPLFFLQALHERGKTSRAGNHSVGGPPDSTSAVIVAQMGAATVIQGRVDDHDLIVVGKASQAELLDLIESALP